MTGPDVSTCTAYEHERGLCAHGRPEQANRPVRQADGTYAYRGLTIRKRDFFTQVTNGRSRISAGSVRTRDFAANVQRKLVDVRRPSGYRTEHDTMTAKTLARLVENIDACAERGTIVLKESDAV